MIDLKRMRKEKGLTQRQLADILGITTATWNMIENGKANLTERNKNALIEKLNVNPKFLECGDEPIYKEVQSRDILISEILANINNLNKREKMVVLDLINSLENTRDESD